MLPSHPDFIEAYRRGTVVVHVDRQSALRLLDSRLVPGRYRAAHLFWSWVWMLSIPGFIAVAIFYKWWVGLLLLFLVTPAISNATKQSACGFILEHALEDARFFDLVVEHQVLRVEPKPGT